MLSSFQYRLTSSSNFIARKSIKILYLCINHQVNQWIFSKRIFEDCHAFVEIFRSWFCSLCFVSWEIFKTRRNIIESLLHSWFKKVYTLKFFYVYRKKNKLVALYFYRKKSSLYNLPKIVLAFKTDKIKSSLYTFTGKSRRFIIYPK